MAELAVITKRLDFHLEQVQDFTPTPMTVSTETWYTGYDPYTLEPVFSAKTPREKLAQRQFFFWYKPEERRGIEQELHRIGRSDLIQKLYAGVPMPNYGRNFGNNRRPEFERDEYAEKRGNAGTKYGKGRKDNHKANGRGNNSRSEYGNGRGNNSRNDNSRKGKRR